MNVLVLNTGSSTLKYSVVDADGECRLREGQMEWDSSAGQSPPPLPDFAGPGEEAPQIVAVAHRVVHGGPDFSGPVRLTESTLHAIERAGELAPLHNAPALANIRAALSRYPDLPHVAVFDTAFHHDLPEHARRYAVPEHWYQRHGVRRYGFHGISHASVARQAAAHLRQPLEELRLITLHLGNGASATAVAGGRSVDTSMGMTPLEGLVMGTRSGDLDTAAALLVARREGLDPERLEQVLTRESGLAGLCGDGDLRTVLARCRRGDARAQLALSIYCYRIRKYIGAYFAVLGGLDALVFTGGVGEHAGEVRSRACEGLEALGIAIDPRKNALAPQENPLAIESAGAAVTVLVARSAEDLEIARQARDLLCQR